MDDFPAIPATESGVSVSINNSTSSMFMWIGRLILFGFTNSAVMILISANNSLGSSRAIGPDFHIFASFLIQTPSVPPHFLNMLPWLGLFKCRTGTIGKPEERFLLTFWFWAQVLDYLSFSLHVAKDVIPNKSDIPCAQRTCSPPPTLSGAKVGALFLPGLSFSSKDLQSRSECCWLTPAPLEAPRAPPRFDGRPWYQN